MAKVYPGLYVCNDNGLCGAAQEFLDTDFDFCHLTRFFKVAPLHRTVEGDSFSPKTDDL